MMGRGWWAVVGLLLALSLALRHSLLFLMGALLALVGGFSWLWARYSLAGVSYRRRFASTRLFLGEETDLAVEVVNAKPLPLAWLRTEDDFPIEVQLVSPLAGAGLHAYRRLPVSVLSLGWYQRVTRRYRIRGVRRGVWEFGPLRIASGDIFGLYVKRQKRPETDALLVYPRMVPITALGLPARHPFGDLSTPRRVLEDPLRLMSTRQYVPGDSFRHIHWKASARQRELQTKVFEPSATRPLAIFLNVNAFEYLYEGVDRELTEYAISAAASIARYAWEHGYEAGLYVNSVSWPGGERIRIRPAGRPDQPTRILEALARTVEYGRWPIEAVLQAEAGALRYGTTLVLVTPLITDPICRTLAEIQRRGHAVAVVALGSASLAVSLPGVRYYHIGGRKEWRELEALQLG